MEKLASLIVLFFKALFYWSWMVCTAPGAACWAFCTTCCYLGLAATCCAYYYAAWVILHLAVYCCQRVLRLLLSLVPLPAPAAASRAASPPAGLQQKAPATTTTTADNSIPDVVSARTLTGSHSYMLFGSLRKQVYRCRQICSGSSCASVVMPLLSHSRCADLSSHVTAAPGHDCAHWGTPQDRQDWQRCGTSSSGGRSAAQWHWLAASGIIVAACLFARTC